ncbi:MAG TPA: GNAT family N-acetyltransferase [Actinomycetales bacterium]|nr:GNAT family N-acetyltransferase [Actinomycetales bacterium]
MNLDLRRSFDVDNEALSALHASTFGGVSEPRDWRSQLQRHSLGWVGAFVGEQLVGFVNLAWDGGAHAFVLDTAVAPSHQRRGIGSRLVHEAADLAADAGCEWLHADYEPHLAHFYLKACGMRRTEAGLLELK